MALALLGLGMAVMSAGMVVYIGYLAFMLGRNIYRNRARR